MEIEFHPAAMEELEEATRYYESQQPMLGERFLSAVEELLVHIANFPAMFPTVEGNIRQCKVSRFPYAIVYREQINFIQVIAVPHLRRKPRYWKRRK